MHMRWGFKVEEQLRLGKDINKVEVRRDKRDFSKKLQ